MIRDLLALPRLVMRRIAILVALAASAHAATFSGGGVWQPPAPGGSTNIAAKFDCRSFQALTVLQSLKEARSCGSHWLCS